MSEQSRAAPRRWRAIAAYAAAAAISSLAAIPLLGLRGAHARVPFDYAGDAHLYGAVIKSVIDHGWFWTNPNLGAPGIFQAYDYPNVAHESLHLLIIKLLSAFSHDWVLLLNLYFLLGFPVITLTGMFTLRRLGVGTGPAMVAAVLYSYLPTRLIKGEGHLFLDVFFQVPLAVLLLLWVCSADPPCLRALVRRSDRRLRAWAAVGICVLSACTSAYFSVFTMCLLVAGGAWASYDRRSARPIIAGLALTGLIVAAMVGNGLPAIVHELRHGQNGDVGRREPFEAEVFGLKIAQLLLPVDGHRFPPLRRLEHRYAVTAPLGAGENSTISLGLVGDVGFLALLVAMVTRRRAAPPPAQDLVPALAFLNLGAVLLGTIGGFGSLLALLLNPQIRAYSRLAVFIGFFSLLAVALMLDRLRRRHARAALVVLPLALVFGLLDQASLAAKRPYAQVEQIFASDRDLVRAIEARVPPGSAIFVLPYVTFPESVPVQKLLSDDQLRGYLHSTTLRWSFPTMRGRNTDLFVRQTAGRPPAEMLRVLALADFNGILVYRDGYADGGAAIEAQLRAAAGVDALVSHAGNLAFFDLTGYRRRAPHLDDAAHAPSADSVARLLHPIAATYDAGFYGQEQVPDNPTNWCKSKGAIHLDNELPVTRRMALSAVFIAAVSPARLEISGDLINTTVVLDGPVDFARELDVAPGHHVIQFRCDGKLDPSPDPRTLVWRIERLSLADSSPAAPSAPAP